MIRLHCNTASNAVTCNCPTFSHLHQLLAWTKCQFLSCEGVIKARRRLKTGLEELGNSTLLLNARTELYSCNDGEIHGIKANIIGYCSLRTTADICLTNWIFLWRRYSRYGFLGGSCSLTTGHTCQICVIFTLHVIMEKLTQITFNIPTTQTVPYQRGSDSQIQRLNPKLRTKRVAEAVTGTYFHIAQKVTACLVSGRHKHLNRGVVAAFTSVSICCTSAWL